MKKGALDDKYQLEGGPVFLTAMQALARLPMLQRERDRAAGLATAGYVSGYRGSPVGGLDTALHEAQPFLAAHDIRFHPAVNEELAASALWGTQQLHLLPGARRDGIFGMWYGKGPGVDRCGDVFKHANFAGTSRHGGVLVVAGDDHGARSSAVAHQSEHIFSACAMPVLTPAGVQDILDLGLHGWSLSRYSGCWVAMKLTSETAESSVVAEAGPDRIAVAWPDDFALPPEGVHLRWPDPQLAQERRMQEFKIYAAAAYARANGLNRLVFDAPRPRIGIIACGKAWLDVRQALADLGIDARVASDIGLRLYKVGMAWPLEAAGVRRFARGLEEILVVEEKRQVIEYQLKEMLYDWRDPERPRVVGKFDESGEWPAPPHQWLLPPTGDLSPAIVARVIAARIAHFHDSPEVRAHLALLAGHERALAGFQPALQRPPYFCPGCPHSRSTCLPAGSRALGGVGCHLMATAMDRGTLTVAQMGGEGATWLGMAEHAGVRHVFANMGDGTWFHSGLLAVRAAVAARANITYKLLFNHAVAMTGGQPVDGPLTVPQLTRQLAAEGVGRIVVLADDTGKYGRSPGFAPGVALRPREDLEAVQRELRDIPGVTALVFDQTCAAQQRRLRRRGRTPQAARRLFIHEPVCEGCGDCAARSNCLAVLPVATEFGTRRAIDQDACNVDTACLAGCCPAIVTVEGASPRRQGVVATDADFDALPEPELPALAAPFGLLVAGVGGTGVVTIGALLGMAAHLEGKGATVLDMTGMSQKAGAVASHVRIARDPAQLHAVRIAAAQADTVIGCDLVVAAGSLGRSVMRPGRTRAFVNTAQAVTGDLVRNPRQAFPVAALQDSVRAGVGEDAVEFLDASRLASLLLGDSTFTNVFMLGFAWQRGCVPVGRAALMRAIELNGAAVAENQLAFQWGRRAASDPQGTERLAAAAEWLPAGRRRSQGLEEAIARRREYLVDYQDEAYAQRYVAWVERVRTAEARVLPGSTRLAEIVARNAFRLLARKDEYEVARLFADDGFRQALQAAFTGPFRLRLHLAVPIWTRPDPATGEGRKRSFGPWILPVLRVVAKLKVLRGTPLDVFGFSKERRAERAASAEYARIVDLLLEQLQPGNLELAVAIASLPESICGFGPVRQRHASAARARQAELMAAWGRQRVPASAEAA
ncbi:indolepyruvate ferredoxin oxidoreductase family protein [Ramlibacter monticola]|uniref:Indolepyruvate ferredoxin oxidoreductase family protein n=1 Tax=Ramlibacter monticola TaxID=1926872 RepID=A0A936YSU7_9BURK|nr:indolepyruvate ferredoxin oxidoreductase family protein [Ramlibacter monticola]MBL0389810.1 indolepyruvate ferredoxin oxidoreductase family protein [Ramlibacter monticola]